MEQFSTIWTLLISLVHFGIAGVEIGFWMKPIRPFLKHPVFTRVGYDISESACAKKAEPIVRNAGLYNLFIAAGLLWGCLAAWGIVATTNWFQIQAFFLACVAIAGVFGAVTLSSNTLWLQTAPAIVGLALLWQTVQ